MRDRNCIHRLGLIIFVLINLKLHAADIRWDAGGGDGLWTNALNWSGDLMPGSTDRVILDNTFVTGSYEVSLGTGAFQTVLLALEIRPASTIIQLTIPATNTGVPALSCSGERYGLILHPGAIFINASGAASGATVVVGDSIRINNGGRYVHQTPRSHAENVRALSRAAGTEKGEFEFKIPVASSTISVSGQVFGRLKLTAGQNGLINYTGTGTNSLQIRSDLIISNGVNLSFNLEGSTEIGGDLVQEGGTMNLGSTARKMTMVVQGNITQAPGAVITETGTAQPVLVIGGWQQQQINLEGSVINEVTLKMHNVAGAQAKIIPALPFKLELESGIITTGEHTLTLGEGCGLVLPAAGENSFINGALRKRGLSNADFLFPVGSGTTVRWVALKSATGDYTARYVPSNPGLINSQVGKGLAHISALEYWQVTGNTTDAEAKLELSFDNVNSGGVTDLAQLKVAGLSEGGWKNLGNTAASGSAGSSGSVTSEAISGWTPGTARLFTLSSSAANQNPLPIAWQHLIAQRNNGVTTIQWEVETGIASYFELQRSPDGDRFHTLAMMNASGTRSDYQYEDNEPITGSMFYRVVIIKPDSSRLVSKIITVQAGATGKSISIQAQVNGINLRFPEVSRGSYQVEIYNMGGRQIFTAKTDVDGNQTFLFVPLSLWKFNPIVITVMDKSGNRFTQKVMVR